MESTTALPMKPSLLLHICCATCAAYVLRELKSRFLVTAFYYNPNIYPKDEYIMRFSEAKQWCLKNRIPFIEEKPDQAKWLMNVRGHEQDPERGARCTICYRLRLEKTAAYAAANQFAFFGTDLSISPHKDAARLNKIGQALSEKYKTSYLVADFKKQDGFKKAICLSRQEGFYRQNYCGCKFSMPSNRSVV